MELRHLLYFEAVARHEHVSRAARELAIAQPAITKQLKDLERELGGGPLFERVGRRVRLTDSGRALLVHARTILAQVATARAEMRERGGMGGGRVAIGAPPTVGERLLPDALRDFHRLAPDVELQVFEGGTQALLPLLDRGELDLAVVTMPSVQRGLTLTPLFSEEMMVVMGHEHPLASRSELRISELNDARFLLYSPAGFLRETTIQACHQAGFSPQVALDSGSMELLLRLAEAGLGLAILPPLALDGRNSLRAIPLVEPRLTRTMALATNATRALAPAALRMHEFLLERLRLFR